MSKVIVTGANGFVGAWLVKGLLQQGHQVSILCRETSDLSDLQGLDFEKCIGDITEASSINTAFQGMDTVFHLAGLVSYKKSERPRMDLVNVLGTKNVVDSVKKNEVSKLVHFSSVVAIGAGFSADEVLNENSKFNLSPLNLGYFETKKQAEEIVLQAFQKKEIDCVILNPSTIYGPADAKKGSRSNQIKVAQGKMPFYTSGGVSVVGVENVIQGTLAAWKKGRSGERYILAGENLTIKRLFEMIAKEAGVLPPQVKLPTLVLHFLGAITEGLNQMGLKGPISSETAWTSTLFHWFDSSKAERELDFKPGSAEKAIAASVAWMKENGLLNR